MAHLVDELLLFSRELTLLGYPPSLPSPLSILLDDSPFTKWLAMERLCKVHSIVYIYMSRVLISLALLCSHLLLDPLFSCSPPSSLPLPRSVAVERLDELSSSPTAWSPVYETTDDTDDTRVPEIAEGLLYLIAGMTGIDSVRSPFNQDSIKTLLLSHDPWPCCLDSQAWRLVPCGWVGGVRGLLCEVSWFTSQTDITVCQVSIISYCLWNYRERSSWTSTTT